MAENGIDTSWSSSLESTSFIPPPPYDIAIRGESEIVKCWICGDVSYVLKTDEDMVSCLQCHELTPVKDPPPGKTFIQCTCKQIQLVNIGTKYTSCTRVSCKKTVYLECESQVNVERTFECAHCREHFTVVPTSQEYVMCPSCGKVSFIVLEKQYHKKIIIGTLVVLIMLGLAITLLFFSTKYTILIFLGVIVLLASMVTCYFAVVFLRTGTSQLVEDN